MAFSVLAISAVALFTVIASSTAATPAAVVEAEVGGSASCPAEPPTVSCPSARGGTSGCRPLAAPQPRDLPTADLSLLQRAQATTRKRQPSIWSLAEVQRQPPDLTAATAAAIAGAKPAGDPLDVTAAVAAAIAGAKPASDLPLPEKSEEKTTEREEMPGEGAEGGKKLPGMAVGDGVEPEPPAVGDGVEPEPPEEDTVVYDGEELKDAREKEAEDAWNTGWEQQQQEQGAVAAVTAGQMTPTAAQMAPDGDWHKPADERRAKGEEPCIHCGGSNPYGPLAGFHYAAQTEAWKHMLNDIHRPDKVISMVSAAKDNALKAGFRPLQEDVDNATWVFNRTNEDLDTIGADVDVIAALLSQYHMEQRSTAASVSEDMKSLTGLATAFQGFWQSGPLTTTVFTTTHWFVTTMTTEPWNTPLPSTPEPCTTTTTTTALPCTTVTTTTTTAIPCALTTTLAPLPCVIAGSMTPCEGGGIPSAAPLAATPAATAGPPPMAPPNGGQTSDQGNVPSVWSSMATVPPMTTPGPTTTSVVSYLRHTPAP